MRTSPAWLLLLIVTLSGGCVGDQADNDEVVRALRRVAADLQGQVDQARNQGHLDAALQELRTALPEAEVPDHVIGFAPGSNNSSLAGESDRWIATTVVVQRRDADPLCAVLGVVARKLPVVELHPDTDAAGGCEAVEPDIDPDAGR